MGREVRKVSATWEHPLDHDGYEPLPDMSFREAADEWKANLYAWEHGKRPGYVVSAYKEYWQLVPPPAEDGPYRPDWPDAERTHFQIYETSSEGTPISPVCASLEELARWYAEHGDPVYGPVTIESARAFVSAGYAPSFVVSNGRVMSGVEYCADKDREEAP